MRKPYKYQKSGYIYKSIEDAMNDSRLNGIRVMGKTTTRCLGSALDAGANCGHNWRNVLGKYKKKYDFIPWIPGESDMDKNVIDAWNLYDVVSGLPENTKFVYDSNTDGDITDETLSSLPLYSIIGTGDARGIYVDKNADKRSRHVMMVIGYLENGTPLIYDLGKIHAGLPAKYRNKVNFITSPSDQILFSKKEIKGDGSKEEVTSNTPTEKSTIETETVIDDTDGQTPKVEDRAADTPTNPGGYFYTAKYLVDALKYLQSGNKKRVSKPITLNIK